MSDQYKTMSITPPSKMGGLERAGYTLVGFGLLALLAAFLGGNIPPYVSMAFTMLFLVSGGVLLSRSGERNKGNVRLLFALGGISFALMVLGWTGAWNLLQMVNGDPAKADDNSSLLAWILLLASFALAGAGVVMHYYGKWGRGPAGIRNNGLMHYESTRKQGAIAWVLTILCTGFYVILYWFPETLLGLAVITDPLYYAISHNHSYYFDFDHNKWVVGHQWFMYGLIYSLLVLVMGFRYIMKYRHNKYQVIRTLSVTFFQLTLSFTLPYVLERLNTDQAAETHWSEVTKRYERVYYAHNGFYGPISEAEKNNPAIVDSLRGLQTVYRDSVANMQSELEDKRPAVKSHIFTYFWPLSFYNLEPGTIDYTIGAKDGAGYYQPWTIGYGTFGWIIIGGGLFLSFVVVVVLTYFFGKRWYCSWVCGCGGLAETAGDPFRHLSDKSVKAWRIERVLIHSVLALVTIVTVLLLLDWKLHFLPEGVKSGMKTGYGFMIGSMFAGVVGTGFYPLLGSRVWCRFGCPQAAVLGLLQKYFSRFRITTNGNQCISCGNCSTYCEMGIDVKWYAQRGQNVVRASCVGCGVCSAVCPRGVLNLENGPMKGRYNGGGPISISKDEVKVGFE